VLGGDPETVDHDKTLNPSDIANVLTKYPDEAHNVHDIIPLWSLGRDDRVRRTKK
jgi:hypothetical protein